MCVYHAWREGRSQMLPGDGCQEDFLYSNTRLLARQFLLVTPLISRVDKVHTSTIDAETCFLIPCTSSELTGEARVGTYNFSTTIEYKNRRGLVNISNYLHLLPFQHQGAVYSPV